MSQNDRIPYLTADLPGTGGSVKSHLADFCVEEIPLPGKAGGRHAHFLVEKRGVSTPAAVERIARYLGVPAGEIGFAGLKDAQAVTSQWMSLERPDLARLRKFCDKQIRIQEIQWRPGKLLAGQLLGNRFVVRIRDVSAEMLSAGRKILDVLLQRGVPNYFGEQRFGTRDDNGVLGEALVRGNAKEFVEIYLGRPREQDDPQSRQAREAFDCGELARAIKAWPQKCAVQRRILSAYMKRRRAKDAIAVIDKRIKRLYISAFQSRLFNQILAQRIQTIDQLLPGDLAEEHAGGKVHYVEDPAAEAARVERFELSPTGLLPGCEAQIARGMMGQIELGVLDEHGVKLDVFDAYRPLRIKGERRSLRYRPSEASLRPGKDSLGPYLEVAFVAPPGCYATVLLDEITKSGRTGAPALES